MKKLVELLISSQKEKIPSFNHFKIWWCKNDGSSNFINAAGKTSAKLAQLDELKVPYISLLTDPTFGGATASFSMLGDMNIAEPNALIGFAGPRVVKETIGKDLPEGFQTSEFLKEHGFIDFIVHRKDLKEKIKSITENDQFLIISINNHVKQKVFTKFAAQIT